MHDLGAQGGPGRRDPLLEAVEGGLHQAAARRVVDVVGELAGAVALLDVPEQPAPGRRVEEAAQGPGGARGDGAVRRDGAGLEVRPDQARLAGEPVVGAEEVGRARLRVLDDAVAVAACRGR